MAFPTKFFGADKARGVCEAQALTTVHDELRLKEADLFGTKWFDYRWMHPVQATHYYAHCYIAAVRIYTEKNKDRDLAATLKVFNVDDIFQSRDLSAVISARQALDRIGCRYEWALGIMGARYSERGWAHMPRPNQLYAEELMMDIVDAWKVECKSRLQIVRDTRFQLVEGEPLSAVQEEHVEWLLGQVAVRDAISPAALLGRLLKERLITRQIVQRRHGDAVLKTALRFC